MWFRAVLVACASVGAFLVGALTVGASAQEGGTGRCVADPMAAGDFRYAVRMHSEMWFYSDTELAEALDTACAAGVNVIDAGVVWAAVDLGDRDGREARRTYDWRGVDRLVRETRARRMEVNFQVRTTPDWVHPYLVKRVPNKEIRKWHAPRGEAELDHFAVFLEDLAGRYEGRVNRYEIWNEPNHTPFWPSGPNPGEYAALLREAYTSLKATDPRAEVVLGGLALNNLGYLRGYYRAVENNYPGAASKNYFFDVLGVHPYVHPYSEGQSPDRYDQDVIGTLNNREYDHIGEVDGNFMGFRRMKALMDAEENASGPTSKHLYFSEFGYRTVPGHLTDERRALYLKRAYEMAREVPYVDGMSWFTYYANDAADPPEWSLLDERMRPTLSFRALQEVTGTREASGVTSNVTRVRPRVYSLGARLDNLPDSQVRRWELYVDGRLVNQSPTLPIQWTSPKTPPRNHKLMLAVYTTTGSVWHSDIVTVGPDNRPSR